MKTEAPMDWTGLRVPDTGRPPRSTTGDHPNLANHPNRQVGYWASPEASMTRHTEILQTASKFGDWDHPLTKEPWNAHPVTWDDGEAPNALVYAYRERRNLP